MAISRCCDDASASKSSCKACCNVVALCAEVIVSSLGKHSSRHAVNMSCIVRLLRFSIRASRRNRRGTRAKTVAAWARNTNGRSCLNLTNVSCSIICVICIHYTILETKSQYYAHAYPPKNSLSSKPSHTNSHPTSIYTVQDHIKNPTKKAPGKGGHHLTLCYPSTHPSSRLSEAS